jgi:hypothetical protein
MLRFLAGVVSALLLVGAGFFMWRSQAENEQVIPPAPEARPYKASFLKQSLPAEMEEPPAADAKTKEEKRFARADKDDDGKIAREEMLSPRRKAFAKLDKNGNGSLSFEEWAVKTVEKFEGADADGSGWLSAAEFETTKAKPAKKKKKCAC